MRIIGGTYRGKKLIPPQDKNIRPTTDRMRETLFNMLEHGAGPGIRGSKILDLFAGTGALGLEALSRSADHVTFVENNHRSMKLIKENAKLLGNPDNASYLSMDASKISKRSGTFDVIFMDPPYRKDLVEPTLENILKQELLTEDGIIVAEYASDEEIVFPEKFEILKSKKMGDATFSILMLST
ncbi:16S rRNA (guanine(966)-N(2))-methyltransferase RsmD [Pseudemcibacter aquimaris]|uniref:16S rRNA (guanine(966)-N(2))-methyltransferase RsmD n=1 Tax=Pseudemcibacter aquimaris TaxID=2857064 RepID=UPI002013585F|nr:16S rRNA (guanine(966)-N(2))-methyltransferase RsmD [Pseudemcibacter aquimaris]MCC3862295.1 16S rRNA (guanine(966)-N(2))-methyltransferase RsmD [Pseudemcibacter aquimaris]WDU59043.1 16S rRNA (guanine(966)-N(2))-methyltransferase RsmD [Pseudemcibacter aquimaris]